MRSATRRLARAALCAAAVGVALVAGGASPSGEGLPGAFGVRAAQATERGFEVGDLLQAIEDVELDEATIAKGSKVSVSARKSIGGRILLDIALADGHIVRGIPLLVVRGSFRRIDA